MFDKIKSLFETYSESKEDHQDPTLRTLNFKLGIEQLKKYIGTMLEDLHYKQINFNSNYNEFFAEKLGYEVTFYLTNTKSGTDVNISVFSLDHRGKTRKALRFLLNELKIRVDANV